MSPLAPDPFRYHPVPFAGEEGWTVRGRVHRVIDGDTWVVYLDQGFHDLTRVRLRLLSVDTPEVRGEERTEGLAAKAWVWDRLESVDGHVMVTTLKDRKTLDRWVARVWLCRGPNEGDWTDLGRAIVEAGHGELDER